MKVGQKRVPITQRHINVGVSEDAVFSTMALAMRDAGYRGVMVCDMWIVTSALKFGVTPEVGEWINWYDAHPRDRSEVSTEVLLIDDQEMMIDFEHEWEDDDD